MKLLNLILRFDGGCLGNGTPEARASFGWTLHTLDNHPIAKGRGNSRLPTQTNNTAEYEALIAGLRWIACLCTSPDTLRIEGDSKLVLETLVGNWKIKADHLKPLRETAWKLLAKIDTEWEVQWIPRDKNSECDELAEIK